MENQFANAQIYEGKISTWKSPTQRYVRCYYKGRCYLYHRLIMQLHLNRELKAGELVDHIDGNTMNNDISNLRVCSHSQNMMNQKRKNKGVRFTPQKNWQARITADKKQICLGRYKTKKRAISAYNKASKEYHGQFGKLSKCG